MNPNPQTPQTIYIQVFEQVRERVWRHIQYPAEYQMSCQANYLIREKMIQRVDLDGELMYHVLTKTWDDIEDMNNNLGDQGTQR